MVTPYPPLAALQYCLSTRQCGRERIGRTVLVPTDLRTTGQPGNSLNRIHTVMHHKNLDDALRQG